MSKNTNATVTVISNPAIESIIARLTPEFEALASHLEELKAKVSRISIFETPEVKKEKLPELRKQVSAVNRQVHGLRNAKRVLEASLKVPTKAEQEAEAAAAE